LHSWQTRDRIKNKEKGRLRSDWPEEHKNKRGMAGNIGDLLILF
jgi:hypothetical protein